MSLQTPSQWMSAHCRGQYTKCSMAEIGTTGSTLTTVPLRTLWSCPRSLCSGRVRSAIPREHLPVSSCACSRDSRRQGEHRCRCCRAADPKLANGSVAVRDAPASAAILSVSRARRRSGPAAGRHRGPARARGRGRRTRAPRRRDRPTAWRRRPASTTPLNSRRRRGERPVTGWAAGLTAAPCGALRICAGRPGPRSVDHGLVSDRARGTDRVHGGGARDDGTYFGGRDRSARLRAHGSRGRRSTKRGSGRPALVIAQRRGLDSPRR